MYIDRIKINNFKSFYGETEVSFRDLRGLYKVSGSIGSGKTSLGEAIIFGLFGSVQGKNNKDLISWGEKKSTLELWCNSNNKDIYIRRENNFYGQSPLYVEVNGEELIFTNKKDAQYQLETEYLDITQNALELLCIISFNSFRSLSSMNTKDTREFLDTVLGLDILTGYINTTKDLMSSKRKDRMQEEANTSAISNQLNRLKDLPVVNGDPQKLQQEIDELTADLKDIISLKQPVLDEYEIKLRDLLAERSQLMALGKHLRKEVEFIRKGICPTCHAPIDQSKLEEKQAELTELRNKYKITDSEVNRVQSARAAEQLSLNKQKDGIQCDINKRNQNLAVLRESLKRKALDVGEIENLQGALQKSNDIISCCDKELTQYSAILDILTNDIKQKAISTFVPSINSKIQELVSLLNFNYIPSFDSAFQCTVRTNLADQIPISSLSTGQLKMVDMLIILAVLSSLVGKYGCNVIFLDELFSNLDADIRGELTKVLKLILPDDSTVLIVSHQDLESNSINGEVKLKMTSAAGKKTSSIEVIKSRH